MIDDRGIDTIFGTIMLVLICFISASFLLALGHNEHEDESASLTELEKRFDYLLACTLDFQLEVPGHSMNRTMTVTEYVIAIGINDETPSNINATDARKQIEQLVDFYFNESKNWIFNASDDAGNSMTIAKKGNIRTFAGDIIALKRVLSADQSGEKSTRLLLEF